MKASLKNKALLYISAYVLLISSACHKEGIGGKSNITGSVKHHSALIPNAVVYIKYGSTDFPGTDVNQYDDHSTADANAHYDFNDLRKGNYYLYGVGFDNAIGQPVSGGVAIKVKYNKTSETDVPVTE